MSNQTRINARNESSPHSSRGIKFYEKLKVCLPNSKQTYSLVRMVVTQL